MKKLLMLLLLMCCSVVYASTYKDVIFFGDSLSDNGNLYDATLGIIPKSPPYYKGRFSNGPTWAEFVGNHFYTTQYANYKIYAVGGATAIYHAPNDRFFAPTHLQLEVNKYLVDYTLKDKSNTLFAIWIGANDYFYYSTPAETLTSNVVNQITDSVTTLIQNGGKHFLLLNMPDLSIIPFARDKDQTRWHLLSQLHNQKMDEAITNLKALYPDVTFHFVNIYDLFNDVMVNTDKYNKRYHLNIKNTTEGCWQGGFTFKKLEIKKPDVAQVQQMLALSQATLKNVDAQGLSELLNHSPSVAEAYRVGQLSAMGVEPCKNANEYLFWDKIHPSAIVHNMLGLMVIETLSNS